MYLAACFLLFCLAVGECAAVALPLAPVSDVQDGTPAEQVEEDIREFLRRREEEQSLDVRKLAAYGLFDDITNVLQDEAANAARQQAKNIVGAAAKKVQDVPDTKIRDVPRIVLGV